MKRRSRSVIRWSLILTLALMLMAVGMIMMFRTARIYLQTIETCGLHSAAQEAMEGIIVQMTMYGGIMAIGLSLLILVLCHAANRNYRQVRALREKNAAMEQLNRQTQELAHHQRLETIGTLTSAISHEFNNLLTPIMGYSMMTLEKLPPEEEELYDNVLEIYNASQKAKAIISRLSDLSRKNTGSSFRMTSPDEQIRRTLDIALPAKPEKVEVKLNLNCWDQRICANEIQLSQIFLNLILNGFQAMEAGGILEITTTLEEKNICIQFSDSGCGIHPDIRNKIFDPFFTTKTTGKGTGLGLSIVAQMVEDHNGTIQVDSKLGEGTTFSIYLPRSSQAGPE